MRPLIGISSYREQARWGSWDLPAVLLPALYPDAVAEAGGVPVLLPPGGAPAEVVARLDGLVLAGGADIDPGRYGQDPGRHTQGGRPDRDAAELGQLQAALDRDLPVLAICRGMQLLNVALGGSLVQHLPDVSGTACHDPGPGRFHRRQVRLVPEGRLGQLLGPSVEADCHHHQALDAVAPRLVRAGWAEDGTIEAVELPDRRFCVGVQWHPEVGTDRRLFVAHVEAARAG